MSNDNAWIDRRYPIEFADGRFHVMGYLIGLNGGGRFDPLNEFDYFAAHFKRRPKWWDEKKD